MSRIVNRLESYEQDLRIKDDRKKILKQNADEAIKRQSEDLKNYMSELGVITLFEDIRDNLWKTGKINVYEDTYNDLGKTWSRIKVSLYSFWPVFTIIPPAPDDENHQYESRQSKPAVCCNSEDLVLLLSQNGEQKSCKIISGGEKKGFSIYEDKSIAEVKDEIEGNMAQICYKKKWKDNPISGQIVEARELIIQKMCDGILGERDNGMYLLVLTDGEKIRIKEGIRLINEKREKIKETEELKKPKRRFFLNF